MPCVLYQSISETLEIMGDKELMEDLRQSLSEIKESKTISWETVKAELDF
jgi:hypothetical protein